jgi:hypothetical protein
MWKTEKIRKFFNKKVLIGLVFILVLVVGGFFYYKQINKVIIGLPSDYVIQDTSDGKIVKNERAGLIVRAPVGWVTQKIEFFEGSIVFNTQNIDGRLENEIVKPPFNKGCAIETAVVYKRTNIDSLKEEIKEIHIGLGIKSEEFKEITINNDSALENNFDSQLLGPASVVYFFKSNKIYSFALYWAPDDKENCVQQFNKFLETISID